MSRAKREPRAIPFAEISQRFELASYWWGDRWSPAVHRKGDGYGIRFIKSASFSGGNRSFTYDYFELDAAGVITVAPRGYARDFKPGRVVDIEAEAERYATPDPAAMRIGLPS